MSFTEYIILGNKGEKYGIRKIKKSNRKIIK